MRYTKPPLAVALPNLNPPIRNPGHPRQTLYVVHCVDTEGPLNETVVATFERLESIFGITLAPTRENLELLQNKKIDLAGKEDAVAKCFAPALLKYNANWLELDQMLNDLLSNSFRKQYPDDFENGWVYSWHCMDHIGYLDNPRHKDVGYGNIFRFYRSKLLELGCTQDEINWHFHPLSLTRNPMHAATSYVNSYEVLIQILCRRILEDQWFPVVNRPGFHSERSDSHAFLEQWIPFDYANQACEEPQDQPDLSEGRFGDWTRAPKSWRGYHPSHDDYQTEGACRRLIFRCLNVGTRLRSLSEDHVREAFTEARDSGAAILSFADHDYRDMRPNVNLVRSMLRNVKTEFPDVSIKFSGAEDAAVSLMGMGYCNKPAPKLRINLVGTRLFIEVLEGEIFGPQPFLAIKTKEGHYYHDNFDVIEPRKKWAYVLDDQTVQITNVSKVGVGTAGRFGKSCVVMMDLQMNVISKKSV